jgi:hypothetical protein
MSINCWLVFTLRVRARRARAFVEQQLSDASYERGRAVVLYEGYRYQAFEELDEDARAFALEQFLGDAVVAQLADERGVCVLPEVGQSFTGRSYAAIVSESGLWVRCEADPSKVGSLGAAPEPSQAALEAVLSWSSRPSAGDGQAAAEVMHLVLLARWFELGERLERIPALRHHAGLFRAAPVRPAVAEPSCPSELQPFLLAKGRLTSVEVSPGGRAMAREHRALCDEVFGDFFEAFVERALPRRDFSQTSNRVAIIQYELPLGLADARRALEEAFARQGLPVEGRQLQRTEAFVLGGWERGLRVALKYFAAEAGAPAVVTVVSVIDAAGGARP